MTLKIKLDDDSCKKDISCHMLPCNIQLNGYCKVSKYFSIAEDNGTLISSLRGYPLQGQRVAVPADYTGVILREFKHIEDDKRELKATATFNEFVTWNWDKDPANEDKLKKALQWIDVASVLHKPVSDSDNVKSTKSPQKQRKRKLSN